MSITQKLTREEIAAIFARHPGSQAAVATGLNVRAAQVSKWLKGVQASSRVEQACRERALLLQRQEEEKAAA